MTNFKIKMKAEIRAIGQAWPHPPDQFGRIWTVENWAMAGGDFAGADFPNGLLGGWAPAELALIADLARCSSPEDAMRVANGLRAVWESTEPAAAE
jgi:hypothetical protein